MVLLANAQTKLIDTTDAVTVLRDLLKTEDSIDGMASNYVIHLNTRSVIKTVELVGLGIVNSTLVHPRETFRRAVASAQAVLSLPTITPQRKLTP